MADEATNIHVYMHHNDCWYVDFHVCAEVYERFEIQKRFVVFARCGRYVSIDRRSRDVEKTIKPQ